MDNKEKLKKARIIFFIMLPILIASMSVVFKSIDSMILWKIIASSTGFIIFLGMVILLVLEILKLQKVIKQIQ